MVQTTFPDLSQNEPPKSKARKIYFAFLGFICVATLATIFFYAYLIPLHEDEAGYWFNYTHKDFANRNIPNNQVPNHTFTIYGAKLSLKLFGHNGIGYRFPVIFFSLLSSGALFVLARRFLKSNFKASLAVGLLFLSPWYIHYSHELRGYPSYLFFALIAFILLDRILTEGDKPVLWILMLGSFVGCYYSSMGAVVFIFNFMATLWVLKVAQLLMPKNERLAAFQAVSFRSFLIFSVVATAVMSFIVFNLDLYWTLKNRNYQIIFGPWDWTWVVKLMADVFSTFLGYRYLDDPTSVLYNYPLPVWIFSLLCFFYGLKLALASRQTPALLFLVLCLITVLFNIANQHYIQTRAVCYLLPFLLIFQGMGLIGLIEAGIKRTGFINQRQEAIYGTATSILLIYFLMHTVGKYQNLEVKSGNPYQQVKSFLINNTAPTDLIISSLRDTVGGFYLGSLIRRQSVNIFKNDRLASVIYLTRNPDEKKIMLKNFSGQSEKVIDLAGFSRVAHFKNSGVRGDQIFIYKSNPSSNRQSFVFGNDFLKSLEYFGTDGQICRKQIEKGGVRLHCKGYYACITSEFNFPKLLISKNNYQLSIFNHVNDRGTKFFTMVFINHSDTDPGKIKLGGDFFAKTYKVNHLVDELDDIDMFRKNVDTMTLSLEQLESNQHLYMCTTGNLFNGNSLLKGIKLFNFKL